MKRLWELDELVEHFTLLPRERDLLANKTGATRLGFAILLKYFEYAARFPESPGEIPKPVVSFLAKQLDLPVQTFGEYDWQGRAIKYHRAQIREAFGFRETTIADARALGEWLCDEVLPHGQVYEQALAAAYGRCRACRLVPPTPARMERLVRSALRTFEGRFCAHLMAQLAPEARARLDALLTTADGDAQESYQDAPGARGESQEDSQEDSSDAPGEGTWSLLADLKADPGRPGLASVLSELAKLERLRALALPAAVFRRLPAKLLRAYRQRVSAEPPRELRRHPAAVRYTRMGLRSHR